MDVLEFQYRIHFETGGEPYATLFYELLPGMMRGVTSRFRSNVLQFQIHNVLKAVATESTLKKLNEFNSIWGRGTAFYDFNRSCYELSISIYVAEDINLINREIVRQSFFELVDIARELITDSVESLPSTIQQAEFVFINRVNSGLFDSSTYNISLDEVEQHLHELDFQFQRYADGKVLAQKFYESDHKQFVAEVFTIENKLLAIRVHSPLNEYVQLTPSSLRQLQNINGDILAGSYIIHPTFQRLYFLAVFPITEPLLRPFLKWLVELCSVAAEAAQEFEHSLSVDEDRMP